nr:EOG090X0AIB [Sida crystallina]
MKCGVMSLTVNCRPLSVMSDGADSEVGWESGMSLADQVKAAAEEAVNQSGFIYNEETGLYYDSNTQLYYNSETGLYYNGFTGTWYRFDDTLNEYVVDHQVEGFTFENAVAEQVLNHIENYTAELSKKIEAETKNCREEGEISSEDESEVAQKKAKCEAQKLAERLPPCARLLIVDSTLEKLRIGTLFVLPYTGGIVGRTATCDIFLDDVNVSKEHAKIIYNEDEKSYTIEDLGSRNGTFLNSERLSESKEESDVYLLPHDTRIQFGSVTLLCHVHSGLETCNDCEPGLIVQRHQDSVLSVPAPKEDLEKARKRELKKIRSRFGLESHEPDLSVTKKPGYQDRAEVRRQTVGVDGVGAKTETASTQTHIAAKNKGFQMLAKMGWAQGQGLGKADTNAIIEPISVEQRQGREGLGAEGTSGFLLQDPSRKRRADVLQKTRERYSQAQ